MLTTEECRTKAIECREMAEHVGPGHRIMLLHIAETWERISAEVRNKLH